jgi:hypothetical protein
MSAFDRIAPEDLELRKKSIADQQNRYGEMPTSPEQVEAGAEEGDWLDYLVNPASLTKQGLKRMISSKAQQTAYSQGKKKLDSLPEKNNPNKIDYSGENIAHRPTYTDTSGPGGKNIGPERLRKK